MAVYNHRAFWTEGYGAQGLDRSILTIHDEIEMDNGARMPSFARWRYDYRYAIGPMREISAPVAAFLALRPMATLRRVDTDGTAYIADPTGVCIGYAPRAIVMSADGTMLSNL